MDHQDSATEWLQQHSHYLRHQFPIHFAACEGDIDRLKVLLDSADPSEVNVEDDFFGWTPTHWAAYFGQLACLRILSLTNSCNVRRPSTKSQWSPLHLATVKKHSHCVHWLLQVGVEIDCKDHLGDTPLHKAARIGSLECASLLISHGATLEVLNYAGMTPAFLAESSGHEQCAAHIRSFQCIMASRLPSMNAEAANGHGDSSSMDCDMEASSLPAPSQAPAQTAPNGFHPFATTPAAQAQMQAAPMNGFHPVPNGFAAQAQAGPPNGFNPFSNGFTPQAQAMPHDGLFGAQMNGGNLFSSGPRSLKRGREDDEESLQKRPCPEDRLYAGAVGLLVPSSSYSSSVCTQTTSAPSRHFQDASSTKCRAFYYW